MWPWGHLAVGYLSYAGVVDLRFRRAPGEVTTVLVAFGALVPDLVDKPLAWYAAVLPNGRSLGHSLPLALLLAAVLWVALRSSGREPYAVAFSVGHLSHLAADAFEPAVTGRFDGLVFLAWPLVPAVDYAGPQSVLERFFRLFQQLLALEVSGFFIVELLLTVAAGLLWARHGFPGVSVVVPGRRAAVSDPADPADPEAAEDE